ncbi:MAG TPA: ATP-binding protein [Oligoflexus sp.]|uniref:ATP-binding protein n=1 Tax=Oligoflexus sp. TaxID=1971216 RepID=UPI002D2BA8AF|nr:ATP-binding protein [Oligoflexus sp.]HYX34013.1 ATP-binding protein [Oligoflexus sp.]
MPFETSAPLAIDVYQKTFRRLHTAKGSARSLGFEELAQSIHELESALLLLKEPKDFTPDAALAFSQSWEDTRSVFGVYLRNYQMLCGYAAEGTQQVGTPAAPTKFNFQTFCLDLIPMIARTALDLKKPLPHLRLLCHTLWLPGRWRQAMLDAFQHLLTNAIDHGLENEDEMRQSGMREQGRISLVNESTEGRLRIVLRDNGKGIDISQLRARVNDTVTPDDELVRNLIFANGFSTRASASQFSGRGVGLDAVREGLAEQGIAISINLLPHERYSSRKAIVFVMETAEPQLGGFAA